MKKIISLFVALIAIVALAGCFTVNEVTSIEFLNAPAATYEKDAVVKAEDFSVVISFQSGNPLTLKLNDARLTVTGLDGDKLDTKTHGRKTINISYQGFSVSVSYEVKGQFLSYWTDNRNENKVLADFETTGIATAADLAQFAFLVNQNPTVTNGKKYYFVPEVVIDLSDHEWVPIIGFQGTIEGQGATIKGLKITDGTDEKTDKGFIGKALTGAVVNNLTFDGVFINSVSDGLYDTNKNYAAVIGHVAGMVAVNDVTVVNSTIVGHGRVGAIAGMTSTSSNLTITNAESQNNVFTAVNGFAAKSADGNGDKVAGLVGQAQGNVKITDSSVKGVTINGTRDLGGLVGFVSLTLELANNVVENSIIQASVPGGMLPTKGTRSIGVFVGTVQGAEAGKVKNLVIGEGNTYVNVTMLANTLYEEITVTGVLFGGLRAGQNGVRNIVIGDKTYQLKSLVAPTAENIADYAVEVELVTAFLLKVYQGEVAEIPTGTVHVEITELV